MLLLPPLSLLELLDFVFHRLDLLRSDSVGDIEASNGEDVVNREALENRRLYRSGIGDLARRPPALMRFCRRSLSRCRRSLGLWLRPLAADGPVASTAAKRPRFCSR